MFGHLWTVCANIVARHAPFIRGLHVCTIIVINVTDKLVANVIAETLKTLSKSNSLLSVDAMSSKHSQRKRCVSPRRE